MIFSFYHVGLRFPIKCFDLPISVKPHYPLPSLLGDLTFRKINYSTQTGGQIPMYYMAGMHFRKLPNSYSLQNENCQLKSWTIKCPTIGANVLFKLSQNPPSKPRRGVVGLKIDRHISSCCGNGPVIVKIYFIFTFGNMASVISLLFDCRSFYKYT